MFKQLFGKAANVVRKVGSVAGDTIRKVGHGARTTEALLRTADSMLGHVPSTVIENTPVLKSVAGFAGAGLRALSNFDKRVETHRQNNPLIGELLR